MYSLELEVPTVVSATRHEERLTDVPYAVSVITAEDIRAAGATSVPEALRLAVGVDVAALGLNTFAVSPRGFHGYLSNKTLVLVDGRQIYDAVFGGTVWQAWDIQIDNIERIEVIRGPAGVTWGTNALNGIINIITKEPRGREGLTYTQRAGTRGFHREHMGLGYSDETLSLHFSGEYDANDGSVRGGTFLTPLEDEAWSGRSNLVAEYQLSEKDLLTFSGGHSSSQNGQAPPLALRNTITPRSRASHFSTNWTRELEGRDTFSLTAFVNEFTISNGVPAIDYAYQQFALQASHAFDVDDHHFMWGVDSRLDLVDASRADPYMLRDDDVLTGVIGAYINDEWSFAEDWRLDLGARLDYDSYAGFDWSGRAALLHQLNDHSSIYGAISRAYQTLPGASRSLDVPIAGGLARLTVDRDIPTTSLFAYEVGYRTRPIERLELSVTPFWHEYDNVATIVPVRPPPGLIHMSTRSRGDASLYGVELEAKYRLRPDLMLLGNYTYQMMDYRSSSAFTVSDLIEPAPHKFMLGVRHSPTDDIHLSSHLYFTDDVNSPDPNTLYRPLRVAENFRLDLRAEFEFWEDKASLAVGVQNLLDNHHIEGGSSFINSAEVPRMVFAEFRLNLN